MWRMSGIFRETFLLFRDAEHIKDVFVRTEVSEDLSEASLKLEIDKPENLPVTLRLTAPTEPLSAKARLTAERLSGSPPPYSGMTNGRSFIPCISMPETRFSVFPSVCAGST